MFGLDVVVDVEEVGIPTGGADLVGSLSHHVVRHVRKEVEVNEGVISNDRVVRRRDSENTSVAKFG